MSHEPDRKTDTDAKLVRMANQIATFFRSQPEVIRPEGVAAHINKFWEPRMRRALLDLAEAGSAGFDPLVTQAVPLIRRPFSATQGPGTESGANTPRGRGDAAGQSLSEPSLPEAG